MATRRKKRKGKPGPLVYLVGLIGLVCLAISAMGLLGKTAPLAHKEAALAGPSGSYYPLEVGRYWVYVRQDPRSGLLTEVERRIVRREQRPDQELFFFADGMVAFRQDGKIFEMGPEGGVNVVPLDSVPLSQPYAYRSQGLHIEKQVVARDTVLVRDGHRYENCVQVITRFHRQHEAGDSALSYASYYARGIGLVGREIWPPGSAQTPVEVLREYGPRNL
jgi:hypothetical protein